jgi:hypothetical protein
MTIYLESGKHRYYLTTESKTVECYEYSSIYVGKDLDKALTALFYQTG